MMHCEDCGKSSNRRGAGAYCESCGGSLTFDGKVLGVNQHPDVLTGQFLPDSEDDGSE